MAQHIFFVNKLLLEHSYTHILNVYSMNAFILQQQYQVAAAETIWPTNKKYLPSWSSNPASKILVMQYWVIHLTPLCFIFFICEIGITVFTT